MSTFLQLVAILLGSVRHLVMLGWASLSNLNLVSGGWLLKGLMKPFFRAEFGCYLCDSGGKPFCPLWLSLEDDSLNCYYVLLAVKVLCEKLIRRRPFDEYSTYKVKLSPSNFTADLMKEWEVDLRGPFNHSARLTAGLPRDWWVATMTTWSSCLQWLSDIGVRYRFEMDISSWRFVTRQGVALIIDVWYNHLWTGSL